MKSLASFCILALMLHFTLQAQYFVREKYPPEKVLKIETDTLALPFFEDWSSGSFEENGWTTEDANVLIDTSTGNDAPSLKISIPDSPSEYSYSLTSAIFNATHMAIGEIYIEFDLHFDSNEQDLNNSFFVEIYDSAGWTTIYEMPNYADLEWKSIRLFTDSYVFGQYFKIRFRVEGNNPQNVNAWHVDNISVYRYCQEPNYVLLDYYWEENSTSSTEFGIRLEWDAPIHQPPDLFNSYTYDPLYSGIGLTDGGDFSVASKWILDDYPWLSESRVKRIRYTLNDNDFEYLKVKIWSGENADSLVWESDELNPPKKEIQTVDVTPPIELDSINILYVGYTIVGQPPGTFPAGTDAGPAVAGLGDLLTTDGVTWQAISDFGLDYNWIIGFSASDFNDSTSTNLHGYNIYRADDENSDYLFYDFVQQIGWQYNHVYFDSYPNVEIGNTYCYKLTAEWVFEQDTCESEPARSVIYPIENFVCGLITDIKDQEKKDGLLVFPNPVKNILFLNSENEITHLSLRNSLGQTILDANPQVKQTSLNLSEFNSGIYFLTIKTKNITVNKTIVINN